MKNISDFLSSIARIFFQMSSKNSANDNFTIEQLDRELTGLYNFCKENNFSDEEIRKLFSPFLTTINRARLLKHLKICILTLFVVSLLYFFCSCESVSWHLSAIGRILMIKILPIYDWTVLKDKDCLIPKSSVENLAPASNFDCVLCESISEIDILTNYDHETVFENYVSLHTPVILENALDNWKIFNKSLQNVTEFLLTNQVLSNSYPCKLSTNTHRKELTSLSTILSKIPKFPRYFLQFQNCEFDAVKNFRIFSPRPAFVHPEIAPIQYSWLLASKNYNVSRFKNVDLQESIAVIGQTFGKTLYTLIPQNECENECFPLEVELIAGQAMIVTSLWNLEYKCEGYEENIAVILETH